MYSPCTDHALTVYLQLASDEYLPLSTLIEGVVILRKNPNHVPDTTSETKK